MAKTAQTASVSVDAPIIDIRERDVKQNHAIHYLK